MKLVTGSGRSAIPTSPKRVRLARWLHGDGIELGALHKPLPVPADARVSYVDRLSVEGLRSHYPELADLDLVPVSHIGSAEDLSALPDGSLDFVIACHVLEHLENPTRGLAEIYRVLRDGGIFFCALPEARVTFDRCRELTTVEHLVDDHPAGTASRRSHFVDWVDNVELHQDWWSVELPERDERVELLMTMDYSIHYHVWRPDTFLEYLFAIRRRLGINFEPLAFEACEPDVDDEFILLLRKGVAPTPVRPPAEASSTMRASATTPHGAHRPLAGGAGRVTSLVSTSRRLAGRAREEAAESGPMGLVRATRRWVRRRRHP